MQKESKAKIYFNHTSKYGLVKMGLVPAATICAKLSLDGKRLCYGISMCSKDDSFSRSYGREIAESRMNNDFGSITIPEDLMKESDHNKSLYMLYSLTESLVLKPRRWKRKISHYNMRSKLNTSSQDQGKLVTMTVGSFDKPAA